MLWSPSWLSPVALPTSYSAFPSIGPVQPPFLTYTSVFFHLLFLLPPKLCSRPYPTCLLSAFKSQTSLPESPSCTSHPNGTPQNHSHPLTPLYFSIANITISNLLFIVLLFCFHSRQGLWGQRIDLVPSFVLYTCSNTWNLVGAQ